MRGMCKDCQACAVDLVVPECHYYPPRVLQLGSQFITVYPEVKLATDWCMQSVPTGRKDGR